MFTTSFDQNLCTSGYAEAFTGVQDGNSDPRQFPFLVEDGLFVLDSDPSELECADRCDGTMGCVAFFRFEPEDAQPAQCIGLASVGDSAGVTSSLVSRSCAKVVRS